MSDSTGFRIGFGYDIHRLAAGRRLVLGGVSVEYPKGLLGHSDGDVVLHAVADALLGAAGLPDIGELFPDTAPEWKDADSRRLLIEVMARVRSTGFEPVNVDLVIHAETPKLSGYKQGVRKSIASLLALSPERVGVKAKTNEGLEAVGRGEAMACSAIVLVQRT